MSKQLTPIDDLRNSIDKLKPQIKAALPAHIPTEKFARVLMTAISTTPALVEATRNSLFGACLKLAQQGLLPDGKEAAIVTFRGKEGVIATAMPMVAGILKLVRNSGELASITSNVVHENDAFEYFIDETGDHLKHTPNFNGDRGDLKLVYAIAKTKDGAVYSEVMSKSDIEKVRNASRAKDGGPWTTWYAEMARKTAIRRLSKRLPMSTDLDDAVRVDDEMYDVAAPVQAVETAPETETPAPKKSKKLADVIEAQAEPTPAKVVKNYAPGAENPPEIDESEDLPI